MATMRGVDARFGLPRRELSPFFTRGYGSYTEDQIAFCRKSLIDYPNGTLLDPMAGMGKFLAELAWEGHHAFLGDLNPAALLLALLRDPYISQRRDRLFATAREHIRHMAPRLDSCRQTLGYTSDWVPQQVREALQVYQESLPDLQVTDPSTLEFWRQPKECLFLLALPLLAARSLTTFTRTNNTTWSKPGGVWLPQPISEILLRTLAQWRALTEHRSQQGVLGMKLGTMTISWMDVERPVLHSNVPVDVVITSPPYANRLDYARLWGPELGVTSAMLSDLDVGTYQKHQLGSNFTHQRYDVEAEESLPSAVRTALKQIRAPTRRAGASYYYPYFRNYAIGLTKTFQAIGKMVRRGGAVVVFVRDTVTADVLFETHVLITEALASESIVPNDLLQEQQKIIRAHVGLARAKRRSGVYGPAQREWWLAYRKVG